MEPEAEQLFEAITAGAERREAAFDVRIETRPANEGLDIKACAKRGGFDDVNCLSRKYLALILTFSTAGLICGDFESQAAISPSQANQEQVRGSSRWAPLTVPDSPSTEDICGAHLFDQSLVPVGEPTSDDNQTLLVALQTFARRTVRDDFSSLTGFLDAYPSNPWRLAVATQLGREYYRTGRYSRAIGTWKDVWDSGRANPEEVSTALVNRSASQLAKMYARLGRMNELSPLLEDLKQRSARGQIPSEIRGASDGLWSMEHKPEVSFRCGPVALDRICFAKDRAKAGSQLVENSESTTNGFSAFQVAALSRSLGMNYQVAFRTRGAKVILPAVVHWKVGHYAAVIARDGDLLRAEDPTFGNTKVWLSDAALDDEASGYFLVRSGPLPEGWRAVSDSEAGRVWGKGQTYESNPDETLDESTKTCRIPHADYNRQQSVPMAQWNVNLLLASHHVEDTPVGYAPPIGPPVYIRASYDSVNGWPLYGLPYSNVSQEWRLNWLAYVTDDPLNPAGDVRFAAVGGGALTFTDFNPTNQVFQNLFRNRALLLRTGTNSYELLYPDGSKQVFDQPDGSIGTERKLFMSAVVDASGNATTIQFDMPGRITTITDAIGQKTRFFYDLPTSNVVATLRWVPPYILTRVMDPFGRTAFFDCAGDGVNARLHSITDPIGLTSSFIYEYSNGLPDLGMTNLITPYGTTTFKRGSHSGIYRANWVEITHPDGEKERVEYSEKTPAQIFSSEPLAIVPKGVPVRNYILWARNTYYWDRKAYAEGYSPNDYRGARIYHWTHGLDYNTASGILESFKEPLEHRVWFNYDGQVNPTFVGTSDRPTKIARTLEDGTTQLYQLEYNAMGNPTRSIDPVGRTFTFVYAANDVDLTEVRQTRAGQDELLFTATYNAQHSALTVAGADRQTNYFTYNARGQLLTFTDARGAITTLSYDPNGYLVSVDGPLPGTNDTTQFSYDSVGRVRTMTDRDGYTLTFGYDVLDRLTTVTYPDGTYEQVTYDRLDPVVLQDRAGRQTKLTFDSLRRLTAVEDALGRVTHYQWCGCGGMSAMIDPLGRMTSWTRDLQGRVKSKVYPDGSQIQYGYDTATGWLKSIRDERNQVMQLDFNLDGTLRQESYFNAIIATPSVKFTYDPNYLRILAMEDGTGVTTYGYHPIVGSRSPGAGRLAFVDGPLPNDTLTYEYDELGREATRAINGVAIRGSWDAAGRLTGMTNTLGQFTYSWEGASFRLSTVDLPNGEQSSFSYFPNTKDRMLQQITHQKADSSLLSRFTYDYNAARQITQWTQERTGFPVLQHLLEYDAADELTNSVLMQGGTASGSYSYVYDAAGNPISGVTPAGARQFQYSALNQTTGISGDPLPDANYEWDAAAHLTAIVQASRRSEFTYDGFGRRTRILEKTNGVVASDRRYLWSGAELCEERDASGTVLRRFFSQGFEAPSSGTEIPPGKYFYHRDHLGSIRDQTDLSGARRTTYDYDLFGQRTKIAGDLESVLGFSGHYTHEPSGKLLAGLRVYDPTWGRWLSRDFIGETPGGSLYTYVGNNPVNYIDPFGLWGVSINFYAGIGGGISLKSDPASSLWSVGVELGFGEGGDVSIEQGALPKVPELDPTDPAPDMEQVSVFVEASGGVGPGSGKVGLESKCNPQGNFKFPSPYGEAGVGPRNYSSKSGFKEKIKFKKGAEALGIKPMTKDGKLSGKPGGKGGVKVDFTFGAPDVNLGPSPIPPSPPPSPPALHQWINQ